MSQHILWTGLSECYDSNGNPVSCENSGQDGEFTPGRCWNEKRFVIEDEKIIHDTATDLYWPLDVNLHPYPLTWKEGLQAIKNMNEEKIFGRNDWRLPNRREMRSLVNHGARKPSLPEHHPFKNVVQGWYWTSTTAAKAKNYAWYVHMEGGRMFYGRKDSYYLIWPVCGNSNFLPCTGQLCCYDEKGKEISCDNSAQDGELLQGVSWPNPRFITGTDGILDNLTKLVWYPQAYITSNPSSWDEALASVRVLAQKSGKPWRLPTINELESIVDVSLHSPALPKNHPFTAVKEAYWSSTTSYFETDWAYVLYLHKGAVGVGYKNNRDFATWPIMEKPYLQA